MYKNHIFYNNYDELNPTFKKLFVV